MLRCLTALLLSLSTATTVGAATRFPAGERWDWQLSEPTDFSRQVAVMDIHPGLVEADEIHAIKDRGTKTICYVSIGTLEKTSPDSEKFPSGIIGKVYDDWPDEQFLDIRQRSVLLPIMKARFESCKAKGFDAIEPDNMDVHNNDSGFAIKKSDTRLYVLELAKAAHELGLAIAQKNVPDMTAEFVDTLDFAITESCYQDHWCADVALYTKRNKAVFDAEYSDRSIDLQSACETARLHGISMILKDRDLTRKVEFCPAD